MLDWQRLFLGGFGVVSGGDFITPLKLSVSKFGLEQGGEAAVGRQLAGHWLNRTFGTTTHNPFSGQRV